MITSLLPECVGCFFRVVKRVSVDETLLCRTSVVLELHHRLTCLLGCNMAMQSRKLNPVEPSCRTACLADCELNRVYNSGFIFHAASSYLCVLNSSLFKGKVEHWLKKSKPM